MGQQCPDRSSEGLKKGALLMSEENNNPEPRPLEVFSSAAGNQLNSSSLDGGEDRFTLEKIQIKCSGYWPGHHFHWIPILRHSQPRIPVGVRWLQDNAFEVVVEGRTEIWYHHDPERIKEALSKCNKEDIKATQGRTWLFINHGTGSYAFNCDNKEIQPCAN